MNIDVALKNLNVQPEAPKENAVKFSDFIKNEQESGEYSYPKLPSDNFKDPLYSGDFGFNVKQFGTELSDDSFSIKYDNIVTSDTPGQIEQRYASKQSTLEKWQNGLAKANMKAGIYAVDALAGTAYGIVNAISEGSLNAMYDNDFAHYLDDLNVELDNKLPNYYTDYEKEAGFLKSLGTANFWANDFAGGLAFLGGTVLSEGVLAMATGGGSLATALPRMSLKSAAKVAIKKGIKEGVGTVGKKKILKEVLKAQKEGLIKKGVIGEGLDLAGFAFRSSAFEAGMEARHATNESIDNFINNYRLANGEEPSGEELRLFINDAKNSANGVFAANMAILAPSNLLMFGKLGNRGIKEAVGSSKINKTLFGIGSNPVKGEAGKLTYEAIKPTKLQKVSGGIYTKMKAPITEGLWEEGLQGVASKTMSNYLNDKYNSRNNIENLSLMNSFYDAFAEQYGTSAGWKENLLGSMIGMVGGTFTSFTRGLKGGIGSAAKGTEGLAGFGKQSYKSLLAQNKEDINALNKATANMFTRVNDLSNLSENTKRGNIFFEENKGTFTENKTADIGADWSYINTVSHHKNRDEILEDYKYTIDNLEIDSNTMKELGLTSESIESYKKDKLDKFTNRLDSAIKAKKAVKYLNPNFETTEGNRQDIEDAIAYNIYAGSESLQNTVELASELERIVGKNGIKDSLQYYNNLSTKQKIKVDEIKALQKEIEELREKSIKLAKVPHLTTFNTKKNKVESFREKELEKNIEIVKLQDELNDKEQTLEKMKQSSDLKLKSGGINFSKIYDLDTEFSDLDITQVIEDLDIIDAYSKSLEVDGNITEAKVLESLVSELKFNLDNARETANLYEQMLQPEFFKTKGFSKLMRHIVGEKYKMSEDTITLLKENNDKVRNSLDLANIAQPSENIEEYIKKIVEEADHLSDRNKFHLEMVIRNIVKAKDLEFTIPVVPGTISEPLVIEEGIKRSGVLLKDVEVNIDSNPTLEYLNTLISKVIESSDQLDSLISRKNPKVLKIKERLSEIEKLENDDTRNLAITQLEQQIEIEENLEFGSALNIENWTRELEKLKNLYNSEKNTLQKELASELSKDEENKFRPTKKEYNRFSSLIKKRESLTQDEENELENLKEFIDQWVKLDGTIVDGISLADLLEQQAILESLNIEEEGNPVNQTDSEIFETDKAVAINATQSFNKVFSLLHKGNLEISGLTINKLIDIINPLNRKSLSENIQKDSTVDLELPNGILKVTVDKFGLKINKDQIPLLNSTKLNVVNTSEDLNTNYNVVLDENLEPLKSDYSNEFVDGEVNEIAIYDTKIGEEIELRVNLNDEFNKDILGTTKQVSEDEIEDAIFEDQKHIDLNDKLEVVEEKLSKKESLTTDKVHKLYKTKASLQDKIASRKLEIIEKLNSTTLNKKELKERMKQELVISVYTKRGNGNYTGTLKSKRQSEIVSLSTESFNSVRDYIVDKYFDEIVNNKSTSKTIRLSGEKVSVSGKYLGHPKYKFKREGTKIVTEYSKVSEQLIDNIVDIGYIEGGKIFTKNTLDDVDPTYVNKFVKASKRNKNRTGIVVIKHGSNNIYYPANTRLKDVSFAESLRAIYESGPPSKQMAVNLNSVLVEAGINPKKEGFVFVSDKSNGNNINDKEFNNVLGKIEQKDYIYNMEEWVNEDSVLRDIVENEVELNIDLSNPFHSPKLELDFSEMDVKIEKKQSPSSKEQQGSEKLESILGC